LRRYGEKFAGSTPSREKKNGVQFMCNKKGGTTYSWTIPGESLLPAAVGGGGGCGRRDSSSTQKGLVQRKGKGEGLYFLLSASKVAGWRGEDTDLYFLPGNKKEIATPTIEEREEERGRSRSVPAGRGESGLEGGQELLHQWQEKGEKVLLFLASFRGRGKGKPLSALRKKRWVSRGFSS